MAFIRSITLARSAGTVNSRYTLPPSLLPVTHTRSIYKPQDVQWAVVGQVKSVYCMAATEIEAYDRADQCPLKFCYAQA